jgi:hypothetical protein
MLALILAAALATPIPEAPPPVSPDETEVSELLVIARRPGRDLSDVTTECVWRELPPGEREALTREAAMALSTIGQPSPHKVRRSVITLEGVALGLAACGAPGGETALPFARTAVIFYGRERVAGEALGDRGLALPRLVAAWNGLNAEDREILTAQTGRMVGGADLKEHETRALALLVWGLIRRLRPLSAFNPLAYRPGSLNHLIVAYYAPRAVRHAMEKRF